MIQLNLFEKIQTLFDIIKSSRLFIVSFIVCISLITIMFLDYKSNKKVNDKLSRENENLRVENRDYKLLRQVFGYKQIDDLLEKARNIKGQKRDNTRSR